MLTRLCSPSDVRIFKRCLRAVFKSQRRPPRPLNLVLEVPSTFEKVALISALEYIYFGEAPSMNATNCSQVLHLANEYLLDGLVEKCAKLMDATASSANCVEFLSS